MADARAAKCPSGQRPYQSLPSCEEDSRDVAIRRMQATMEELRLVLVANNLKVGACGESVREMLS